MTIIKKLELKTQNYLSHYPRFYALVVGIGIVLFWRGVWHSADNIHTAITYFTSSSSMALPFAPWWDGPLSFVIGGTILYMTGAFTSSFIGNELILSGLRGEKRLNERTESDLKEEVMAIGDINNELVIISRKLAVLEKKASVNHKKV
jgi:hypothetical protein